MSEILSNIVVEQTSINFSPDNNNLNITPEAIQLNIFTGAAPSAGQSSNGELLYNNLNLIDGVPNTSFASGNLTLGNVANIKITGGTNGYVLQTDGVGNLGWTAMTGGGGNGSPGGSNTQIQYNDGGLFGGSTGFTFNKTSNAVSMPGNLSFAGTITGNGSGLTAITGANVTGTVANATYALDAGNANFANSATTANTANFANTANSATTANTANFANTANIANVAYSVSGSNVSGQVGNALIAGTVYTNAQSNITSVGTLTSLSVAGTANVTNLNISNVFGLGSGTERVTISNTAANTSLNFNVIGNAIQFQTANAVSNISLNIRGNATVPLSSVLDIGNSVTITFVNKNGAPTAYGIGNISVDGTAVVPLWSGSTGNGFPATINGRDMYTFNIFRPDGATYVILGTRVGFV